MSDRAWKAFERDSAAFFGTTRFPANTGGRADFACPRWVGQCKLVKTMGLPELARLAEEMGRLALGNQVGVVCVKLRRGRGRPSEPFLVMTLAQAERAGLGQRRR